MNEILEDLPLRTAADNATIWIDDRSSGPLGNMVERNEKPNAEAIAKGKSKIGSCSVRQVYYNIRYINQSLRRYSRSSSDKLSGL